MGKKARHVLSNTASSTDMFQRIVMAEIPGVDVIKEYAFHPARKWRFDYAIPSHKVAIEIDGAVWTMGRHNRPEGYINDMEKLNTAASMGWLVLRFTTDDRLKASTLRFIEETISIRSNEGI